MSATLDRLSSTQPCAGRTTRRTEGSSTSFLSASAETCSSALQLRFLRNVSISQLACSNQDSSVRKANPLIEADTRPAASMRPPPLAGPCASESTSPISKNTPTQSGQTSTSTALRGIARRAAVSHDGQTASVNRLGSDSNECSNSTHLATGRSRAESTLAWSSQSPAHPLHWKASTAPPSAGIRCSGHLGHCMRTPRS